MNKTSLNFAALASAVGLLVGCAHKPPPQPPSPCTTPEPIRLTLTASPRLNPGDQGEPLATTVRIYQLKDTAKLVESSLDRLLDGDRGILADDFVSVLELTLYPGERAAPPIVRGEGANAIAVVAFFRRPEGPSWRAIRKLPPPDPQHCHGIVATPAALAASQLRFTLEQSRIEMR
jgi:type VI secretion system protein VasD